MSIENSPPLFCSNCHQPLPETTDQTHTFCPSCGANLKDNTQPVNKVLSKRYQLLKLIGKGGMGEVFLAYDLRCKRKIALKRVREDLLKHPQIKRRFLKEAHITCQLMHPGIIPIYSIQTIESLVYYTMPFVEGETLKQIIRRCRLIEKKGEKSDHLGGSIPALMAIFVTICQAIAYAHSRGILHRDIKLENIMIGKYGEVFILDWGLAKNIDPNIEEFSEPSSADVNGSKKNPYVTKVGKIVGTVAYMAPERGLGNSATIQTDIYSLGVILYQMLTLRPPFKRGTLDDYKKIIATEDYLDPVAAAPYRDVPHALAKIANKCLSKDLNERYSSVDAVIYDLKNYLEGRSDWFYLTELNHTVKLDWEFQENVLLANYIGATKVAEDTEWVNLMISKQSFPGNIRIETTVCLQENAQGIGILFCIPEVDERSYIYDGYCLWLGSEEYRTTKLLRSNVEVMQAPDIFLKRHQIIKIRLEKIDHTIHLYLNDVLQFSYIAHIPLLGTHIGLLSRDTFYELNSLKISLGSLNLNVNCLAVPDAFLAHRDFNQALSEYRRIANSFPDRVEGREAIFRAGLTLIEQGKTAVDKNQLFDLSLQEFEKLHKSPSGPLEYLGKALVYQTLNESEEEIKCFEIAFRRYPKHPLLLVLQEQILSRLHLVSRQERVNTYRFILLTVRHFPPKLIDTHTQRLFNSLQKHWEHLPFIEESTKSTLENQLRHFSIPLSFWLNKAFNLEDVIDELIQSENPPEIELNNALAALIEMNCIDTAKALLEKIKSTSSTIEENSWMPIEIMIYSFENSIEAIVEKYFSKPYSTLTFSEKRCILFVMNQALKQNKPHLVHQLMELFDHCELSFEAQLKLNIKNLTAYLLENDWQQAGTIIHAYPLDSLLNGSSPLHFLYGCWLQATEGRDIAMIHFASLEAAPYPRSWNLATHQIAGKLDLESWLPHAFEWEKKELNRQLALYSHCCH